jgi:hypothetical protein
MGLSGNWKKNKEELSPADKGFEAARHEDEISVEKRKQILKTHVAIAEKNEVEENLQKLAKMMGEQQEKLDALLAKNNEVSGEEEHEFVENVETEQIGAGIMLDYVMLKHTDIVIIIGIDSIGLYESFEDFEEGKDPVAFLEIEEMEKVNLEEPPENVSDKKVDHALMQWHNDNDLDSATEQSARSWIEKFNSMHELNQLEESEVWKEILKELNSDKK